jgi:hypothetical protein
VKHRQASRLVAASAASLLALSAAQGAQTRAAARPTCHGARATIVARSGLPTVGTNRRDVIVGTQGDDQIDARAGDDLVCGRGGDDFSIRGGPGNDRLDGGPGTDVLFGEEGNDRLEGGTGPGGFVGGPGDDRIVGGPANGPGGLDIVLYDLSPDPVHVDLAAGQATGEGSDVLKGIDAVDGSRYDDVLLGNSSVNFLSGEGGNDVLDGRGGDDSALFDNVAVNANLATGLSLGEGTDQLVNLEGLIGSHKNDTLIGNGRPNYLAGGDGNDAVAGGTGEDRVFGDKGDDTLDGGLGDDILGGDAGNDAVAGGGGRQDTISYLSSRAAVQVDLATGQANGQGSDTLTGIQNVSGSQLNDRIVGDSDANGLSGNAGRDRIVAGPGADFLGGGSGRNVLSAGAGTDYCLDGAGAGRCEIRGVPGPLPGKPGLPPHHTLKAAATPTDPAKRWAISSRARLMRSLGADERRVLLRVDDMLGSVEDDLSPARGSGANTAPYDYIGQPTCVLAQRETTIAPPRRVEPIGKSPQQAWWRATLYRRSGNKRWKRYWQSQWLTGSIAGGPGIPGAPVWQDAKRRTFVTALPPRHVPPGQYVWKGEIYWDRTGGIVFRVVEPHIVYAPDVRHEKLCNFKR